MSVTEIHEFPTIIKAAEAIRQVVGMAILADMRDPRRSRRDDYASRRRARYARSEDLRVDHGRRDEAESLPARPAKCPRLPAVETSRWHRNSIYSATRIHPGYGRKTLAGDRSESSGSAPAESGTRGRADRPPLQPPIPATHNDGEHHNIDEDFDDALN